jgi:hypothetical protein
MSCLLYVYIIFISVVAWLIVNWLKLKRSATMLIHPPLSVLLNPNNWYQSFWHLKNKSKNLREIIMDSSNLKENFIAALEDLDKANLENDNMKYKLKKAEDYIKNIKVQIDISRRERQELVESLK